MGVDRTDYIVFGFKMSPELLKSKNISIDDDKYLPYIEGHKGEQDTIVYDYMMGKYVVFGKLINQSWDYEEGKFTTISYQDFFDDEETKRVTDKFIELFGQDVLDELEDDEPQMFVFSHYS